MAVRNDLTRKRLAVDLLQRPSAPSDLGFRISDFFRTSAFGFRISFLLSCTRTRVHTHHVDQATEAQPGRPQPFGGIHWLIWTGLFLLFAYPLSTGPLCKLRDVGLIKPRAIELFYALLILLSDNCRPLEEFLSWYVHAVWSCKD